MTTEYIDNIINRVAFVASGSFNPAILHPDWFLRHSILPSEEVQVLFAEPFRKDIPELGGIIEFGKHFIVEPTQSILNFKSLALRVDREKFEMVSEIKEQLPVMIKAIRKIFSLLPETPISAYGINFIEHIQFEDSSENILNKFFTANDIVKSFFIPSPKYGHKIITKTEDGSIILQIEHSSKLPEGLFIHLNFHHQNSSPNNDFLIKRLELNFEESMNFGEKMISSFCGKAIKRLERLK